jgi:hypothetical protein
MASSAQIITFFILYSSLDTRCQALVAINIAAVENGEFDVGHQHGYSLQLPEHS